MIKAKKGFTMIELMIVVAIIGILAAVAVPKFADMLERAREGATKGNIGAIKSAISIYYGDNTGEFPGNLETTDMFGNYLDRMPAVKVKHPRSKFGAEEYELTGTETSVTYGTDIVFPTDADGWKYNTNGTNLGDVWLYNGQTDTKGISYQMYGYE